MTPDSPCAPVLLEEHLLLGARLSDEGEGTVGVASYPGEGDALAQAREGALLADLTGSAYLLAHGPSAADFASAAFAGRALAVGEAAFAACLAGDGSLVSVPLVMRCGDAEHVVLDLSARGAQLRPWLGFLAGAGRDSQAAFPGVVLEDASGMLVPLLLGGRAAHAVLSDYVSAPEGLPEPGEVRSLRLDAISALAVGVPLPEGVAFACHLLLVPVAAARTLWRSFLSFEQVAPAGLRALGALAAHVLPWGPTLAQAGPARIPRAQLAAWGLARAEGGFVGARALRDEAPFSPDRPGTRAPREE